MTARPRVTRATRAARATGATLGRGRPASRLRLAAAALAFAGCLAAAAQQTVIGDFSAGLEGWEERSFVGNTDYEVVRLDGVDAVRAAADGTASALYRRIEIDLESTPYLVWRWRVGGTYGDIDETEKSGDDYPARVYVVRRGGLAFWRTRALNYVWSSAQPAGSRWPNAYAGDNVQMLAVDAGEAKAGEWVSHVRDVRADWRAAFGEEIETLDGVAIMTDADDAGGSVRAWYADIRFTSERPPADPVGGDAAGDSGQSAAEGDAGP